MKKSWLLLVVMGSLLASCGENESSYSEVDREQVNRNVNEFIESVETSQDKEGNGIYKYYEKPNVQYLYVDQDFLDSGKGFGGLDIKTDKDTLHLYLMENDEPTIDEYRLYRIESDREYEYAKVYKNGEETYFETIGVKGD